MELATAVIFALLCWHYQLEPELGVMAFYACLFIIIFVIDLEHGLILSTRWFTPSMVVALLLALIPQSWLAQETWLTQAIETLGLPVLP